MNNHHYVHFLEYIWTLPNERCIFPKKPIMFHQISTAFKSAIRNFQKNKVYGSLNILGLSIAFATMILAGTYLYQETTYEGYGVAGIAFFVEASTHNLKRTVANVRAIFSKYEGSLGTNGSLEFLFDRKGVFTIPLSRLEEWEMDDLEMELIDGGVEDFEKDDEVLTIFTSFEDFGNMQKKLEELSIEPESQELQRIPKSTQVVSHEDGKKILLILEKFEEDDDVSAVYHNMEITEELMAEMGE